MIDITLNTKIIPATATMKITTVNFSLDSLFPFLHHSHTLFLFACEF